MHLLIYSSLYTGTEEEINRDLLDICESAKRNSPILGITSVLFYHHGKFLQLLEGEEDALNRLMAKLKKDSRHTKIRILVDEPIMHHGFKDWHMETFNLSENESIDDRLIVKINDLYLEQCEMESWILVDLIREVLKSPGLKSIYREKT